jgi:hypothetical protein
MSGDNIFAMLRIVFFVAIGFVLGRYINGCSKTQPVQTIQVPTQVGEVISVAQLKTNDSLNRLVNELRIYYKNQVPTVSADTKQEV